jgi:hypothetical protein
MTAGLRCRRVSAAVNLILLLHYANGYKSNSDLLFIGEGIFILLLLARFIWLLRKTRLCRQDLLATRSIRETIDYLPGGICFATPNGRPVLTNRRMNELIYRLTGHTIMNARLTWEELRRFNRANGCAKLDEPWLHQARIDETAAESVSFALPDGSIWRFRREELTDRLPHYVQLEATDISDLYRHSKELYENRQRLSEQYQRRRNLLTNIVEINHRKEILHAKMRIHDDMGRSILTTKQHLLNRTFEENIPYLAEIWNYTIRSLEDFPQTAADAEISSESELQRAAEMIGCRIDFHGKRPVGRKTLLLLYAAVRAALTNAVMHANANQVGVTIRPTERGYHVEISDNGTAAVSSVTEGSGLGDLRRRLEQEGAALHVQVNRADGVVLIVELPSERKDTSVQEGNSKW